MFKFSVVFSFLTPKWNALVDYPLNWNSFLPLSLWCHSPYGSTSHLTISFCILCWQFYFLHITSGCPTVLTLSLSLSLWESSFKAQLQTYKRWLQNLVTDSWANSNNLNFRFQLYNGDGLNYFLVSLTSLKFFDPMIYSDIGS